MASVTLPESAKLCQDKLISGVIENVITVDYLFDVLPFIGISGNSLKYNRENALGDVQGAGVGDTITAKNAATFTSVTSNLTTILGDAHVNNMIQKTRSTIQDQTSAQIESKAKSAGRTYRDWLINGTGASNEFNGLINLCAAGQTGTESGTNGSNLSFAIMDEIIDLVTAKDGEVDYIAMHSRTIRSYKSLLRGLGGTAMTDMYELPTGRKVIAYGGVPIFRNDNIPTNQTKGTGSNQTSIFAGVFDDGSENVGLAGLTAEEQYGIDVQDVGLAEDKDEHIWRVVWYCGLALFSEKALAMADGIND